MAKNLTTQSYSLLLKTFSSDEDEAALAYAKLHDSLTRFFQIKGDAAPDEAADETLDRVAAKLVENVSVDDLTKYSFGVARFVFLERLRKANRAKEAFENFHADNIYQVSGNETDDAFLFYRKCFEGLPDEDKSFLQEYFIDLPHAKLIEKRQRMADKLGIDLNNLRLKIFRMRRRLEQCVREQLKNNS